MSRAGDFASSRRPRVADHAHFVRAKAFAGVPTSAIARMINCNAADVQAFLSPGKADPVIVAISPSPAPKPEPLSAKRRRSWVEARSLPEAARPTVETFARMADVSVDTFLGRAFPRHLIEQRAECWAALRETGRWSLPQIGSWFGGRDHTTIMSGITRHAPAAEAQQEAA